MLGEHLRGRDARGICYVEREAAGAASLVASMDAGWLHPAPVWSDLATFDGRPWRGRVHCVASGDPCQGNSVAGKGLGADDPRFLIPHVLRIVGACRPPRLFRENVTGNAAGQLSALVGPLEDMGYRVAAGIFSSGRTGNSHGRERLIIMANRNNSESGTLGRNPRQVPRVSKGEGRPEHRSYVSRGICVEVANADGGRGDAWAGVSGDAPGGRPDCQPTRSGEPLADTASGRCDPRSKEPAGEVVYLSRSGRAPFARHGDGELVDADRPNVARGRGGSNPGGRQVEARHARLASGGVAPPPIIPGPDDRRWADILDHWPQLAPALSETEAQSLLRGGIDALASRIERLRAIGNGVDPVVGATAWLRLGALLDADRERVAGTASMRDAR